MFRGIATRRGPEHSLLLFRVGPGQLGVRRPYASVAHVAPAARLAVTWYGVMRQP
jgi:hypothetical protein